MIKKDNKKISINANTENPDNEEVEEYKDFAFIDFPSVDEAGEVLKEFNINPIKLQGRDLYLDFSRLRKCDEMKMIIQEQNNIIMNAMSTINTMNYGGSYTNITDEKNVNNFMMNQNYVSF
jgi:RNA recognition motif-containing protein